MPTSNGRSCPDLGLTGSPKNHCNSESVPHSIELGSAIMSCNFIAATTVRIPHRSRSERSESAVVLLAVS
uniref:OrfF n=1 Tax=Leptolyngbya sp. PCC 6402 TaxID=272136 RepID=Q60200_9CYAN|nr:OrfF [Leptolyngbya sp. PCC 6402]